jgi:hypothetical protein
MLIGEALNLKAKEASDAQLDTALRTIGAYKLNLRQRFRLGIILIELGQCNEVLDKLIDEMLFRQSVLCPKPKFARERDRNRLSGQHDSQRRC